MTSIFILYTLISHRLVAKLCSKNPSYLIMIGRDLHSLILSDNLNGREAD
jgi:hypothetical protein